MDITLKDVAAQVGVDPSTVSRALNSKDGVSERTRSAILATVKRLGYIPNATARGLARNRTESLGFLVNPQQLLRPDAFYLEILEGVETVSQQQGYQLVFSTNDTEALPKAKRVDGLILAGCDLKQSSILSLKRQGVPLVLVDNHLDLDKVDSVTIDNVNSAYEAVAHLAELGHRAIGFIAERLDDLSFSERFEGYRRALKAYGLDWSQALVAQGLRDPSDRQKDITTYGQIAMQRLLARTVPTAVFAANDTAAAGAMRVIRKAGLRVPEDVAIVGFDDSFIARHTDPRLTTMRVFREEMGRVAARRLLRRIEEPDQPALQIKFSTQLIVRESCGTLKLGSK
ncbi:MAG TPA: LacI family transcriptional regulator [Candidatus Fraserbacteria bacterium]|nr:LacI family transcriptional regulator [Candidatus Fraserbacteria bacterium]